MFSRRLAWSLPRNRLTELLEARRRDGAPLIDLTEANPTRVGLAMPAAALAAALADPGAAVYEPAPRGLASARAAVAAACGCRGLRVPPERIVLTAGTSEAYALLFKLLADPGDAILAPKPSYPLFEFLANLEGVRVAPFALALDERRFALDLEVLDRAATEASARAIVLVNPNNPTGTALRAADRRGVQEIAARRGAAIIADEVFFDYLIEPAGGIVSMLPGPAESAPPCLTFTLGGLSKGCGMPQMKLAWIVVDGPAELAVPAMEHLEMIADTYLSVGTPVQLAAGPLLALGDGIRDAIRRRLSGNREAAADLLRGAPACRLLESDGGWYVILEVPAVMPEEDLTLALLRDDDLLVHPGYFFDFPRECYLVLSLLPEPDRFAEGLRRILARASP